MFISVVDVSTISGTPTLTVISKPANGTATVEQRGTVLGISFVASDGNSAPATISYQLSGSGGVDSGIVTMTILDVNDAPVVADDTGLVITGGTISINVLANDYDVDGTITSVAITIPPFAGSASVQPDNSVLFNATGAPPGTYSVGYRVTDDDGATANGVIVISVTDGSGNAYPVAGNDSVSVVSGFVVIADVLANDTDADGTITAVAIISAPAAGTATVLGDNTIRYDAANVAPGAYSLDYRVTDNVGATDTATLAITVTDNPPTYTVAFSIGSIVAGQTVTASDITATLVSAGSPPGDLGDITKRVRVDGVAYDLPLVAGVGEVWEAMADVDTGDYAFSVYAGSSMTVSAVVNERPVANDDTVSGTEDQATTFDPRTNDTDADGDTLTITSASIIAGGGTIQVNSGVSITHTPAANYVGAVVITYTISDGHGNTDNGTVTLTYANDNADAPDAFAPSGWSLENPGTDGDLFVDILTLPAANDAAVSDIEYRVNGGSWVSSGGTSDFTIPGLTNGISYAVELRAISAAGASGASASKSQVPTQTTPLSEISAPVYTVDTGTISAGSQITYNTPGTYAGGAAGTGGRGVYLGILINGAELATLAQGQSYTVPSNVAGSSYAIREYAQEFGADEFNVALSSFTTTGALSGGQITLADNTQYAFYNVAFDETRTYGVRYNGTGQFRVRQDTDNGLSAAGNAPLTAYYTPNNYTSERVQAYGGSNSGDVLTGVDIFSAPLSVTGAASFDEASGTIGSASNQAPVTVADTASGNEDATITFAVLSNDSDPDGDTLTVASAAVTSGEGGSVAVNPNNTLSYTPPADWYGTATGTYVADDGAGGQTSGGWTVTVLNVNDAPVAANNTSNATEGDASVVLDLTAFVTDVEGDTLSFTVYTNEPTEQGGQVSITSGGACTYTPPSANWNGTDTFTYTVSDGNGGSDTGTLTFVFAAVNDAPTASNFTTTTPYNTAVDIDVLSLASAADVDGDTLSLANPLPASGTATLINGNTGLRFTPQSGSEGNVLIAVDVTDGALTASITITVTVGAAPAGIVAQIADDVTGAANVGVTSQIVNLPANLQDGDIVFFAMGCDYHTGAYSLTSTGITWTPINLSNAGSPSMGLWYGVCGATPGTNVTIGFTTTTTDPHAYLARVYRGVSAQSPLDVAAVVTSGATGMPDPGSLTSATTDAVACAFAFLDDDQIAGTIAAPATFGNLRASDAASITVAVADLAVPAAGTIVNPGAFTDPTGDDAWRAVLVLLRSSAHDSAASAPAALGVNDWTLTDAGTGGTLNVTIINAPANNGAAITNYLWSSDNGATWNSGGSTSGFQITGLSDNAVASIRLAAVNSVGPGTASTAKTATPTTASSGNQTITYRSTTFNTTGVLGQGVYEDGTPWVRRTAGSQLASTVPASTTGTRTISGGGSTASLDYHGLAIDPGNAARYQAGDMSTLSARQQANIGTNPNHAYDGFKGKDVQPDYDPAMNFDPGKTGSPLALNADMTLVKATSKTSNVPSTAELILDRLVPLHVIATPPAVGSFAPPICSADKTPRVNISEIQWGRLNNYTAPSGAIPPASEILELLDFTMTFEHLYGPNGENIIAPNPARMDTSGDYFKTATYMGTTWQALAHIAVALHTNAWTANEKQAIVKKMMPFAINVAGRIIEGGIINDNGGWAGGGWIVAWAVGLTDNAWLQGALDTTVQATFINTGKYFRIGEPVFGDVRQHRAVTQPDIDASHVVGSSNHARVHTYDYAQGQLGWPEWGSDALRSAGAAGPGTVHNSLGVYDDHPEAYRHIKAKSDCAFGLAANLCPQMRAAISGVGLQMLYYVDRYMGWWAQSDLTFDGSFTDWTYVVMQSGYGVLARESTNAVRQWVLDLWTAHRGTAYLWTPSGVLPGEQTTFPSLMTINEAGSPVYPVSMSTALAPVALSGTHNGSAGDVFQYRLVNVATSAVVQNWTDFTASGASTWSLTLQRPRGFTRMRAEVRAKYDTGVTASQTAAWAVGDVVLAYGQSLLARPLVHTTPNPSFTPPANTLWILYNDANGVSLNPDATTADGLYGVGASSPLGLRRIAATISAYGDAPMIILDATESGTGHEELHQDSDTGSSWAVRMGAVLSYARGTLGIEPNIILEHWFTNNAATYLEYIRHWLPIYTRLQLDGIGDTGNGSGVQDYTGGLINVVPSQAYTPDHFLFDLSSAGDQGTFDPAFTKWVPAFGASHFAGDTLADGAVAANDLQKAGVRHALETLAEATAAMDPITLGSISGWSGQESFGGHIAMPGGTHVASGDIDGESLAGVAILTAALRATQALPTTEHRIVGVYWAADGSYADVYWSLPHGGQASTAYIQQQAGAYAGSLEGSNWVTPSVLPETTIPELHNVMGYRVLRNGSPTFINFTAVVHDPVNGIHRITPTNGPFVNGVDAIDFGYGDSFHMTDQADANSSRPHIHYPIETRPLGHVSGTGYGWPGVAEPFTSPIYVANLGASEGDTSAAGNTAPTMANFTVTGNQDTTFTINFAANTVDPNSGDTLTWTVTSGPTHGSVTNNNDGTASYTPTTGYFGGDSITVQVSDGMATDTATVTLTVNEVVSNTDPVATDFAITGTVGVTQTITLAAYTSDPDSDDTDLSVTPTADNGGTITNVDLEAETFDYTPASVGTEHITFTITDGNGGTDTGTITVTVSAAAQTATITEGNATMLTGPNIPANTAGLTIRFFGLSVAAPGASAFRDLFQIISTTFQAELDTRTGKGDVRITAEDSSGAKFVNLASSGSGSLVIPLDGTPVDVSATATTSDGTNSQYQFYVDGTAVIDQTNAPAANPYFSTTRAWTIFGEGIGLSFDRIEIYLNYYASEAAMDAASPVYTIYGDVAGLNSGSALPSGWTKSGPDFV